MQYNLAFTYFELNRVEEARVPIARAYERWPDLFQLHPDNPEVQRGLAQGRH